MSERKGINKYYPPDWDPTKVPKKLKPKSLTIKVRLETPYSMRCLKCDEYIGVGRKFNAKKEITKEKYLNMKILRIHISCPHCNNPITFKTSPQTAGYVPETGARRNYTPKQSISKVPEDHIETEDEILLRLEKEEQENKSYQILKEKRKKNPFWKQTESLKDSDGNIMEALEKRLDEQVRQQQLNDELEDLQHRSSKIQEQGGTDMLLDKAEKEMALHHQALLSQDDEDVKLAMNAFKNLDSIRTDLGFKAQNKQHLKGRGQFQKIKVRRKENSRIESRKPEEEEKDPIQLIGGYSSDTDEE
ncbi:uncharacterized protein PRCAT00001227001 [Priceomyces carsonii]|uniref:uncharacterized protein n=1 Tax=Priceomyces carsonii TaxID=28549 RepID=UPI002EDAB1B8|nr:unnamed protein product [Priceomyces carsonii]